MTLVIALGPIQVIQDDFISKSLITSTKTFFPTKAAFTDFKGFEPIFGEPPFNSLQGTTFLPFITTCVESNLHISWHSTSAQSKVADTTCAPSTLSLHLLPTPSLPYPFPVLLHSHAFISAAWTKMNSES